MYTGTDIKNRFTITNTPCITGFNNHVTLDASKPIETQLTHQLITYNDIINGLTVQQAKDRINWNSSYRVSFGWAFESATLLSETVNDALSHVLPMYNSFLGYITSDQCGNWIGFLPFNAFEREAFDNLSLYELAMFNNNLIEYQAGIVKQIVNNKCFQQHALLRDADYRYSYCKKFHHSPDNLENLYHYYVNALSDTLGVALVTERKIYEDIGCHYLHYPAVFFECLMFYKLKGVII